VIKPVIYTLSKNQQETRAGAQNSSPTNIQELSDSFSVSPTISNGGSK